GLHDAQVRLQLLRTAVGEVGVPRAGRGDAAGDRDDRRAVRPVRRVRGGGRRQLVRELTEPLPQGLELGRRRGGRLLEGQLAARGAGGLLEGGQSVLGGERGRLPRDLRGDVRVAV